MLCRGLCFYATTVHWFESLADVSAAVHASYAELASCNGLEQAMHQTSLSHRSACHEIPPPLTSVQAASVICAASVTSSCPAEVRQLLPTCQSATHQHSLLR